MFSSTLAVDLLKTSDASTLVKLRGGADSIFMSNSRPRP